MVKSLAKATQYSREQSEGQGDNSLNYCGPLWTDHSYAVMFVDNRIQESMLLDLNKEIMDELGVTVGGDIIAILKHAKVVHC